LSLFEATPASEKRERLRAALAADGLLRFPGAFSPLVAMMIERLGFDGVYVSGAVLSNDLGLPDIGLTTLSEVAGRAQAVARVTALPAIVDVDTGFGEAVNAARTIRLLEDAGIAGCHLEDQVQPKRCGHLEGKELVDTATMVQKVRAAASARSDPNFLLIARTDARAVEGLDAVVERAQAYVEAGADMIFPEALADASEFEHVRAALDVPLLANMTEFGKSELLSARTLEQIGIDVVIYPVTTMRLAMGAVADGLRRIRDEGTQERLVERMQTRQELYELLGYNDYEALDRNAYRASGTGGDHD
jgi:methylisocitrate lyase